MAEAGPRKPRSIVSREPQQTRRWADWLLDRAFRILIWVSRLLPYRARVPALGALVEHVLGPLAGYRRRAIHQLQFIWPNMSEPEARRIASAVLNNTGRTLIENYDTQSLLSRAKDWPLHGTGLDALDKARAAGRPILLITGHFGNYEAGRAALVRRGFEPGGLYRPLKNAYANAHYVATMQSFGGPVFPRGRDGLKNLVRFIRGGGQAVMLIDQFYQGGEALDFLGQPALTSLSAAELALKYDALLVPFYATRQASGLDFEIEVEAPIPHTDPRTMTQALTDSLAKRIKAQPEQWFWVHRRWKPDWVRGQRARKAARQAQSAANASDQQSPGN
ncbi:MAG: lysophospholipid acyltransferase family protein [Pseudomonadota bacterium]